MKNVCILNGIHRGAVIGIGEDPVLIGGDDDCDALLSDSSADGAVVGLSRDPAGGVLAKSVRGPVSRGMRTLRTGRQVRMADGSVFRVGGVDIALGNDLATAERAVGQGRRHRAMLRWSGACVVGLALFGLVGAAGGPADAYDSDRTVRTASAVPGVLARDPVAALEREIARVGLSGVGVVGNGDGRIRVTGSVDRDGRERWEEVVRWFDGRFGDAMALDARLAERDDDIVLPFRIVSVRAAPGPSVVIQNGEVFPVGSLLPGGWEVRRIAELTVVLVRGDREVAISF